MRSSADIDPGAAKLASGSDEVRTAERIRISGAKVHFQGVRAVDGVDLEVRRGEILGLIGPNGAGKTTLLNAITGFQALTDGTVTIGESDVTGWSAWQFARAGVARTFQQGRVFSRLTVADNLRVAAMAAGLDRAGVEGATELIETLGLGGLDDAFAGSLAYGQERRVELARALATRPSFLFLDEPAAGLNDAEGAELVKTITESRDRTGAGVVIIDHDMHVVMTLCERIHVLAEGRTLAVGAPEEIRRDPVVIAAYLGSSSSGGGDA